MKRTSSALLVLAFGLPLVLLACSTAPDDDGSVGNESNAAGKAGVGGNAGAAGKAGSGGLAGTAGQAGAAGKAGGSAGRAGSSGSDAGSGGSDAGSGGSTAGSGGSDAGSGGSDAGSGGSDAGSGGSDAGSGGSDAGSGGSDAGSGGSDAGSGGSAAGSGGSDAGSGGSDAGSGGSDAGSAGSTAGSAGSTAGGGGGGAGGSGAGGSGSGAGGSGGAATGAYLRFGNLDLFTQNAGLGKESIDFCIQAASASSWTNEKPLVATAGSPRKLLYPRLSVLIAVPSGEVRLRSLLNGGTDCTVAPPPTAPDVVVTLAPGSTATYTRAAVGFTRGSTMLPDVAPFASSSELSLQAFNGRDGAGAQDFGIVDDSPGAIPSYFLPDVGELRVTAESFPYPSQGLKDARHAVPAGFPRFLTRDAKVGQQVSNPQPPGFLTKKPAAGERYNVYYLAKRKDEAGSDLLMLCQVLDPAAEQAAQVAAGAVTPLPHGPGINHLCLLNR